jgi:hypothetical protein
MESDRNIGRVLNVDSFRVVVEIDKENKSLTKTHYFGIYPVARINSYIIIPVGYEKIVGHITRVQMFNEAEEPSNKATITLPQVKRLVWATMIGTIKKGNDEEFYEQGITTYPSLDNPVCFILREELDIIFDKKAAFDKESCRKKLRKKYYLPIGKSTAFPEYDVKIEPDALFSKHLAVLGNTGSGKSCTISSLIQTLLKTDYDGKKIDNAHFVILDTNGEYKSAFIKSKSGDTVEKIGNILSIDKEGFKVPYWFMNLADFINIFEPGEGTQLPVLSNALLFARNKVEIKDMGDNQLLGLLKNSKEYYANLKRKYPGKDEKEQCEYVLTQNKVKDAIVNFIKDVATQMEQQIFKFDVDNPIHFDRTALLNEYVELAIRQSERSNNRIRDYCATMLMRMQKYYHDPRYDFLFHNFVNEITDSLATFIRLILGQMENGKFDPTNEIAKDSDYFLKYYFEQTNDNKENHQIVNIDLSLIAADVLENITALIGRLILEFLQLLGKDKSKRGTFPVVLILEEAHNYIPERIDKNQKESVSKTVFERIAREGRKYGLSLVVSSQRPSELSKTVLSQCNSFIVHRIQNPEDQKYIQTIVPSVNEDLLKQLPSLAQRTALIFGDCVRSPAQLYMNEANPLPDSKDPQFMKHWLRLDETIEEEPDFEMVCKDWEGQENIGTEVEPKKEVIDASKSEEKNEKN